MLRTPVDVLLPVGTAAETLNSDIEKKVLPLFLVGGYEGVNKAILIHCLPVLCQEPMWEDAEVVIKVPIQPFPLQEHLNSGIHCF